MKKLTLPGLLTGLALMLASNGLFAEAGISYTTGATSTLESVKADVKFKITIPKLMILRVGDWAGTVNTVEWTYAFGSGLTGPTANATEDHWNGANATTGTDVSETSPNSLDVWAFGNTGGSLKLTAASTDFALEAGTGTAGGNKPKLSEITAVNTNGTTNGITHPTLTDASTSSDITLPHSNGIVSLKDKWTYTYTPTATPSAGTYNASVIYTLAAI
ncbi:MAG: hypothetical protein KDI15_06695 [Thiothrix sp.]|nr:hypothetical protein [Thiothrix sp.]HPE58988.1 hypothetical protein [Thiolinea sp.]